MRIKKNRSLVVGSAVIGMLATGMGACAAEPVAAADSVAAEERPIEGLGLRQQMVLIQGVLSRVATDAMDARRVEQSLDGLEELQRRIVAAKRVEPPRFGDLDDAAQVAHDRAFRALFAAMLGEVAKLEVAVLEGALEVVEASLAEMERFQEKGHAAFQPPREGRPERVRAELDDKVVLTAAQRAAYAGAYEFKEVGFRLSVVEQEGVLYLKTFGQPDERLYAVGDHRFKIAVSAEAEIRFELGEDGRAAAIILDGGGGREPQRIGRVE